MRAIRVLTAAVAAVVVFGFAVGVRQASNTNHLETLLATGPTLAPADQRSAGSALSSAKFGYPGQDVPLLRAQVALHEHRYTDGRSIAQAVTRAEPDNLQGWAVLAAADLLLSDRDGALAARAQESRLDPLDARPR